MIVKDYFQFVIKNLKYIFQKCVANTNILYFLLGVDPGLETFHWGQHEGEPSQCRRQRSHEHLRSHGRSTRLGLHPHVLC